MREKLVTQDSLHGRHGRDSRAPDELGPGSRGLARAWRLRAWDDALLEQAMIVRSVIAISADEIGDVTCEPSVDEYRSRLRAAPQLAGRSDRAIGMFVTYWRMFRSDMRTGDIVAVPLTGRRVAIGEITGDYVYKVADPELRLRHTRAVRWLTEGVPRQVLDEDLRRTVNAPGTICVFGGAAAAERLRAAAL